MKKLPKDRNFLARLLMGSLAIGLSLAFLTGCPPLPGGGDDMTGNLTVTLADLQDETINLNQTTQSISKSGNGSLTATLQGTWASKVWYLDGNEQGDFNNASSVTLGAVREDCPVGKHTLVVFVWTTDGILYSKTVAFTVTR
jgi:hypothetical protein